MDYIEYLIVKHTLLTRYKKNGMKPLICPISFQPHSPTSVSLVEVF